MRRRSESVTDKITVKHNELSKNSAKRLKPENHDPGDTPTNVPELSKFTDEQDGSDSVELGKEAIPPEYDSGSYMGPSSSEDPYFSRFLEIDSKKGVIPFVTRSTRVVHKDVTFTVYSRECDCDDTIRATYETKWKNLEKSVAPYRDQLLALYFRFIDWTYPAVDKKKFYKSYFQKDPPLHRGLVSAMLGLGVTYWKYSTQLCVKPIPPDLTANLWKMSLYYIEHDINCKGPSLDTVQALLLLIQKRLPGDGMHEQIASRVHVGSLVSIAYSLGLHLDCTHWDIDDREKSSRRRLWALVYYVDKWTSANMGHPSLLGTSSDKQEPHAFESEFRQERRFVQLVRITDILTKVMNQLYSLPEISFMLDPTSGRPARDKSSRTEFHRVTSLAEALLSELRNWKVSLPADISDPKSRNSLNYCSNGMIHLSALAVESLIFRVLILPCYGGIYRHEARDLVQRIIMFCLEITHSHLHAFWISSCRMSLSTLTHFVLRYHAQSPEPERKRNTPLMRSWMECLRSLSHGWEEGIGLAYYRMDALFYKGQTTLRLPIMDEKFIEQELEYQSQAADKTSAEHREVQAAPAHADLREEPLGLEEDFVSHEMGGSPHQLLFADEPLRDILHELLWD